MSATAQPSRGSVAVRVLKPLARQSDHRLVELSREGDERAFEALVGRHGHELQVYAGRLLGAEGRAEDALQHALMSAWVALRDRDATVANPRAWLYGIVHNSAVTVLRRARHDTVTLNQALDAPHASASPEVRVVVGEILAGLAEMPEIQRRAIVMTAVAGSSHEEAAAALGVSDGAVRGMVYRARAALRQAAAAWLPVPLWTWADRFGHRRARLPVDPTDAATAVTSASAASAGVAALVVKGGAIVAAVGALAGTGGALLPGPGGRPHHHRPAVARRLAAPHRPGGTGVPSPVARIHGPSALPSEGRRLSDTAAHGQSGRSGRRGPGGGSSSRGRGGSGSSEGTSGSSGSGHSSGSGGPSGKSGGDSGSARSSSHGGLQQSSAGPGASSGGSGESGSSDGRHSGSDSGHSGSGGGHSGSGGGHSGSGSGR